jgi:hypothetical protein
MPVLGERGVMRDLLIESQSRKPPPRQMHAQFLHQRPLGQHSPGPSVRFLRRSSGERDAADNGASHPGTKDCHHHFNHVEERSGFRRPASKSASSLSISGAAAFPSRAILSGGGRSSSGDARFEGEYQSMSSAPCALAPSHPLHAMPPRITRNSDRPRASDRTMVDTKRHQDSLATLSRLDWRSHHPEMRWERPNQPERNLSTQSGGTLTAVGWMSRQKIFSPPVEAELFS